MKEFLVSAGKGFNGINLEDDKKSVDDFLNEKGKIDSKYDDCYFVEYLNYGLVIKFDLNNKIKAFYLYNDDEGYEHMKKFPINTSKNIDWNSNISDIISAYGNTKKHFSGTHPKSNPFEGISLDLRKSPLVDPNFDPNFTDEIVKWDRLEYKGIDFRFLNDKLVRVGIFVT